MKDPRAFLESYRAAFERYDLDDVVRHFHFPGLTVSDTHGPDGVRSVPIQQPHWRERVKLLLDAYRSLGMTAVRLLAFECRTLSPSLEWAEVRWALLDRTAAPLYDFTNLYLLGRIDGALRICAVIGPDEAPQLNRLLAEKSAAQKTETGSNTR